MSPSETLAPGKPESGSPFPLVQKESSPSTKELITLLGLGFVLFITVISLLRNYFVAVDAFGDSLGYMTLASAIRRWDFHGVVIKQFWGLPYAMAALSKLTGLPDRASLLVLSLLPSALAAIFARQLWDGWIAGYFAIINFDWLQRSCLGGSEPLFVCLLLGSFLCVRRERWLTAALLASLATVVRPLGLFVLLGIGIALLWRREFKKLAVATSIGLTIGFLYAFPLAHYFGDALATVNSYHSKDWQGGWLFGVPFVAIMKGFFLPAPWTNIVLSVVWIGMVTGAVVRMAIWREFRSYCREHVVEAIFLVGYLCCLYAYNYPYWARGNFARFAIPVLPFVLLSLYRWLPKDRRVLWTIGVISPVLAACSALGVANVVHLLTTR